MRGKLEDRNVREITPLITPREVKARLPLSAAGADLVLKTRRALRAIIHGKDMQRLVVVVGPCSIHDPETAFEYAQALKRVADNTADELIIVMRTYFEKPRTTVGWKGLVNDPFLDGSCNIAAGMEIARSLLSRINHLGVPCGTEMLDPVAPQYLADLISWGAIGARTIESQTHREMASGLSMPVGLKNGTDGSLQVALNAILSARHAHSFLGIGADGMTSVIKTTGNPDCHIVLRGGGNRTNYGPPDVRKAAALAADQALARPVMVDCSHGNSAKDHTRQSHVCRSVLRQFRDGQRALMGVMLESNLKPGKQTWREGVKLAYGVSITDACIGWEETEALLYEAAEAVRAVQEAECVTVR
ncbi:MAG: 3-deoxy-7-phosphoheptulonate synthase [Planctomycetota bacterium]|nr:3-deoxy-7-phosphoheptulonate synthase [Planctomycetota bacterium]